MTDRDGPSRRMVVVALVAATVVGLGISLVRARSGTVDLWYDDAWVAIASRTSLGNAARLTGAPGFTVLARWWIGVGGGNIVWSQTLALLPFLAIAPAVYWGAWRTCRSRGAALVVACAAPLAPVLLTESARVKQYTLDCLVSAVMVGLAAGAIRSRPSLRRNAAAAVVVVAGVVFSGALLLPAAVLIIVLLVGEIRAGRSGAPGRPGRLLLLGGVSVATLAWVVFVLGRLSSGYNTTWRAYGAFLGTPGTVTGTLRQLLTMTRAFVAGFVPGGSPASVGSLLEVVLLIAVAVYAVRRRRVVWWLLLAPAIALVASAAQRYPLGPIGRGRVDSWLLPWVAALAAQAITDGMRVLGTRVDLERFRRIAVPALVGVFAIAAVAATITVAPYPPTRLAGPVEVLTSHPPSTRVYVDAADMPFLLVLHGPQRMVVTDERHALNSIRFVPEGRVHLLGFREATRRRDVATLSASCGGTAILIGPSDRALLPVERRLPCPVVRRTRETAGTLEHWDDVVTLQLGPRRSADA